MAVVKDTDNGYKELVERLYGIGENKPSVTVGIHEKDGGKTYPDGMTLLEVAQILHFGTEEGHIPPRPFISGWFDANSERLHKEFAVLMKSVVEGKRTADEVLEIMGIRMVSEIQAYISRHGDGDYAPNAPSTIRKKKSSTPLIDKGTLRGNVSYEVHKGEEE